MNSNNIIRVINALNIEIPKYVITGSKAFQLHKIEEDKESQAEMFMNVKNPYNNY